MRCVCGRIRMSSICILTFDAQTGIKEVRSAVSRVQMRETAPIRRKKSNNNFHGDARFL
jgi:hypothetical protein